MLYYNSDRNISKRFQKYIYILFIIVIVFYIYTLLNIEYNDSKISSKKFTFISNYTISYIRFFYLLGLSIILFIIYQLYYVLNKKPDFIVSEYQETKEEKRMHLKNFFGSVKSRNIANICYFLITFIPANIIMILKYILNKHTLKSYFIDFIVISLISFFGSFIFLVKLFDPLIRSFIINLLLFNRDFIFNEQNININNIMNEHLLLENNENIRKNQKLKTAVLLRSIDNKKEMNYKSSFSKEKKPGRKSDGRINIYVSKLSKPIQNMSFISQPDLDNTKENKRYEMTSLNYFGKKNNSNMCVELNNQENNIIDRDKYQIYNNNNNNFEEQKSNSLNFNQNSFGNNNDIINRNLSKNSSNNNANQINNNAYIHKSFHGSNQSSFSKSPIAANKTKFYKNFHNRNKIINSKSTLNLRSISIQNNLLKRKFMHLNRNNQPRRSISKVRLDIKDEEISSFASINYHIEVNENLLRMIAISISVNECRIYDDLDVYKKYYRSTIPWENKNFYTEKTKFKEYCDETIPSWLVMDKISIDDLLASLDPSKNIKKLKESKVLGGRGNNSLYSSWDKKLILKTIDTNEKNIFFDKMIIDFHCFMRESRSLLSRIYGLYKIELTDKGSIYVIVQRNMDDLPLSTKLLTFDFKGSTVDRQIISKGDLGLIRERLWLKYKNKVLKDKDLNLIGLKFILEFENWKNIISIIDSDSSFLQNLGITDYSLVVFVHKYRKEDLEFNRGCTRIIESKDRKYIFNFSIVDYLGTYNFMKQLEKSTKSFLGYIKKAKDTNFSVLDPINYGVRFRNFIKRIIKDE